MLGYGVLAGALPLLTEHPPTSSIIMVEILRYQIFLACLFLFLQFWYTALANIDYIKSYFLDGESLVDTSNNNRNNGVIISMDIVIRVFVV